MNKTMYLALCEQISNKCPGVRWIDWDEGQLNISGERPAVDFPCCLIDINYGNCSDITDTEQLVTANIILKLAFQPMGESYAKAPDESKERALQHFDVVDSIHKALQGCTLDDTCSAISRKSATKTVRNDKIIVYTVRYDITFEEMSY